MVLLIVLSAARLSAQTFPSPEGRWFPASGRTAAVALVAHGLNLRPAKMDALSELLAGAGIEVFRLALSGHGRGAFKDVTAAGWLSQTEAGYRAVVRRATALKVPVYFLGYSLGGLLGEVLLAERAAAGEPSFDRVVLLAPAIAPRPITSLVKLLFPLGKGFTLPSADSPAYRAHRGTPMAAYEALFTLVGKLRASGFRGANVPTLLFVRGDDELVSLRGIRSIVRDHRLSHWTISVVPDGPSGGYPHHLIIDPATLGRTEWNRMARLILGFFLRR